MPEVLLISREDLVAFASLNGNVDPDKFVQYIKIAQDIHIQGKIGTDLLTKLQTDYAGAGLTGAYATLVSKWIKPALIHWAMHEALPWLSVNIANGGVFRRSQENAETLSKEEVDSLVERERDLAAYYTDRLVDHICNNMTLYPEYTSNTGDDISPDNQTPTVGWVL